MKILNRIEDVFISVSIIIATLLVFLNVILRVNGSGLTWSEELIRYLLIWVTFIGMSVCTRDDSHMSIDFLPQLLRGKILDFLRGLIYVVAIIFSVFLTFYSYQLVEFSMQTSQITAGLGVPFYLVYMVIPVSGCLLIIRYIQQFINLVRKKTI